MAGQYFYHGAKLFSLTLILIFFVSVAAASTFTSDITSWNIDTSKVQGSIDVDKDVNECGVKLHSNGNPSLISFSTQIDHDILEGEIIEINAIYTKYESDGSWRLRINNTLIDSKNINQYRKLDEIIIGEEVWAKDAIRVPLDTDYLKGTIIEITVSVWGGDSDIKISTPKLLPPTTPIIPVKIVNISLSNKFVGVGEPQFLIIDFENINVKEKDIRFKIRVDENFYEKTYTAQPGISNIHIPVDSSIAGRHTIQIDEKVKSFLVEDFNLTTSSFEIGSPFYICLSGNLRNENEILVKIESTTGNLLDKKIVKLTDDTLSLAFDTQKAKEVTYIISAETNSGIVRSLKKTAIKREADIVLTDVTINNPVVAKDQYLVVHATIKNEGDSAGNKKLTLFLDNKPYTTKYASLNPGELVSLDFKVQVVESGIHTIKIDNYESIFEVLPHKETFKDDLSLIIDVDLSSYQIETGSDLVVTVSMHSVNPPETQSITLYIDEIKYETKEIEFVTSGFQIAIFKIVDLDQEGIHQLRINNISKDFVVYSHDNSIKDGISTILTVEDHLIVGAESTIKYSIVNSQFNPTVYVQYKVEIPQNFEISSTSGINSIGQISRSSVKLGPGESRLFTMSVRPHEDGEYTVASDSSFRFEGHSEEYSRTFTKEISVKPKIEEIKPETSPILNTPIEDDIDEPKSFIIKLKDEVKKWIMSF